MPDMTGWVIIDPEGRQRCTPQRTTAEAWSLLRGTYKTTLEGILGYEEGGWTLQRVTAQEASCRPH